MTDTAPKLVNVGSYVTVNDAEFAKMLLEGEGIEAYIADATIVAMDWLLGNAIGWIKVQVEAADEARAGNSRSVAKGSPRATTGDRHRRDKLLGMRRSDAAGTFGLPGLRLDLYDADHGRLMAG